MINILFNEKQLEFIQKAFGYTDRQMRIINLICQNLNNVGVASKAGITYNTAKTHVRNICRKALAHSRAYLILTLFHHSRHLTIPRHRHKLESRPKTNPKSKRLSRPKPKHRKSKRPHS